MFLFSFDYLSVFERKNPLAVIEAFTRAFAPGRGRRRSCSSASTTSAIRKPTRRLRAAAAAHPDIEVIDRYMSPAGQQQPDRACDCYVSLHRAEGFGLVTGRGDVAGQAGDRDRLLGEPRLHDRRRTACSSTTGWSRSARTPIRIPPMAEWAEPDVEHAAALMREVFDDPERAAAARGGRGAPTSDAHALAAAPPARSCAARLEAIRATGRARPADPVRSYPPALAALPMRIRQGPELAAVGGRGGGARERVRNTVLRVMRPFTAYQQDVNSQLVAALQELSAAVRDVRRHGAEERGRLLGDLRAYEQLTTLLERQARSVEALERRLDALEGGQDRARPGANRDNSLD